MAAPRARPPPHLTDCGSVKARPRCGLPALEQVAATPIAALLFSLPPNGPLICGALWRQRHAGRRLQVAASCCCSPELPCPTAAVLVTALPGRFLSASSQRQRPAPRRGARGAQTAPRAPAPCRAPHSRPPPQHMTRPSNANQGPATAPGPPAASPCPHSKPPRPCGNPGLAQERGSAASSRPGCARAPAAGGEGAFDRAGGSGPPFRCIKGADPPLCPTAQPAAKGPRQSHPHPAQRATRCLGPPLGWRSLSPQ